MIEILTTTVYGWLAMISLLVILFQLFISLIFGSFDIDVDSDGDVDFDLSIFVSPKGILHLLTGFCWYLVLSEYTRGSLEWYDYLIGFGIGVVIALLLALLYIGLSKLQNEITPETEEDLIGRTCSIYIKDTADNTWIVNISVNGALCQKTVKSKSGKSYNPGENILIVEFSDGKLWIE